MPRGGGLDAEVERGDRVPLLPHRRDDVGLAGAHLRREVGAGHALGGDDLGQQLVRIGEHAADADPHRAAVAQVPGQRAGVDAADADDALLDQLVVQAAGRPPVGRAAGRVADDEAGDPHPAALVVLAVHAGVADVRGGHHDDLAVVAGVGQRLLVAGHPGGEDRLADRRPDRAVGLAPERPSVLQDQDRVGHRCRLSVEHRRDAPQERRDHPAGQLPAGVGAVAAAAGQRRRVDGGPGRGVQQQRGWPARPGRAGGRARSSRPIAAGRTDIRSATPRQSSSPVSTIVSTTTESACSSPSIPGRAAPTRSPCPPPRAGRGRWRRRRSCRRPGRRGAASHVGVRAQRRVDLEHRVVALGAGVGEQQVVRRDLGGHLHAARLRPAQDLHRARRRDVADVQPGADVAGEQHVAGDDRLLGGGRPAGQAEPGRAVALVHLGAGGEPRLLGVLGDDAVEGLHVLQRPAHQRRVADAVPVVGEHPHAGGGVGHRAELGQPLALQADGHRPDRDDVDQPGLLAEPPDLLDDAGGVGDRVGVGHGVHGGEPAERRGAAAGLDGLGVLPARLAQVGVQVDQAGQRDQPGGVDHLGARRRSGARRSRRSGRP